MGDRNVLERILLGLEKPTDLSIALLQEITENFSKERKIGEGGFGEVYRGVLQNRNVAVKRIVVSKHTVDDKLFYREVQNLMKIINHRNVVRFLGYCSNTHRKAIHETGSTELVFAQIRERLLCFEYIGNGSLDKHITDELRGLEWSTRYEIIKGICDGLRCLHEENNIIHMDLKPGNIMLDNDMVPKITDFGLSRLDINTHTSGTRFITQGYCAPEYEDGGKTSKRADMYSLGIIITELITGRKGYPNNENVLRRWIYRWRKSQKHTLLAQYQQVTKCMKIAAHCRKKEPTDRPFILDIIGILSENERMNWQTDEIRLYLEDGILGIEPLELRFPFEVQKKISCEVKLNNETKNYYAFNIEMPSRQYIAKPNIGIVSPRSKSSVDITMQAQEIAPQDMPCTDDFIVRSTKVDWHNHRAEDIIVHMSKKEPGKVDEVNLTVVVYDPTKSQGNVSRGDVSKDNQRGQCPNKQIDRRNFHPPENFSDIQPTNMIYLLRASSRATDVTSGTMGSLLHKLGELLKDEFNLNMNVRVDIKSSSRELMEMHAALGKLSHVQRENINDDLVKRWASDAREMSYDIEDVIDGFLVHDEPAANTGGFRELTHEMFEEGTPHHQVSNVVKDIKVQVKEVADQGNRYKIDSVVANQTTLTTIDPRLLALYKDQREMVGMDDTRDELIKRLTDGDDDVSKKKLKIISIFGFGGLGKTTLAKAVYERLKGQFDIGAFVSVGRNPDLKNFFKDTLFELDRKRYENIHSTKWGERHLMDELRSLLANNRYFIVIDDIWSIKEWEIIIYVLMDSNCGSKVLTTTRILEVATKAGIIYKLEPLSRDNSKELFYKRLSRGKGKCPYNDSAELSEKILHRCGGVPLAIITMASLLVDKQIEDWYKVYNAIGFGDGENNEVENTRKILLFSYYDLPSYLRTCLLHLRLFPEDHLINKVTLIWKWVAEGFIHNETGIGLFELGERYFSELINRSMIQPVGEKYSFVPSACRLHDMVLDMICSLSKEENFLTVLEASEQNTSSQNRARRLAIQKRVLEQKNPFGKMPTPQVRSFYATSCDISVTPSLIGFKALRVLAMEGCTSKEGSPCHLEHIGNLQQLRYLGFERMLMRDLPEEIGHMRFLQTLWLEETKMKELPHSVGLLGQLKCLRAGRCWGLRVPDWIGNLTSLEELSLCNVHNSPKFPEELIKLTELRDLRITFGSDDESWHRALVDSIGNLRKMERLEITSHIVVSFGHIWEGFVPSRTLRTLHFDTIRHRLLSWINSALLPRLTHLTMRVQSLEVEDVVTLGKFPELLALELMPHGEGCLMVLTGGDLFSKLRYLNTFAALRFEPGSVQNLEHIQFKVDMRDLQRADFDFDFSNLGNLPMLEKVEVEMDCGAARRRDVEKAEESLKRVVDVHPNRPIFDFTKRNEEYILRPEEDSEEEEEEEEKVVVVVVEGGGGGRGEGRWNCFGEFVRSIRFPNCFPW